MARSIARLSHDDLEWFWEVNAYDNTLIIKNHFGSLGAGSHQNTHWLDWWYLLYLRWPTLNYLNLHWGTSWFPNPPEPTIPYLSGAREEHELATHFGAPLSQFDLVAHYKKPCRRESLQHGECSVLHVHRKLAEISWLIRTLFVESIETEGDTFEGEIVVKMGDTWRIERMHMDSSPCHLEFQLLFPQLSDHAYTCIDEFKSSLSKWSPKQRKKTASQIKPKLTHTERCHVAIRFCAPSFLVAFPACLWLAAAWVPFRVWKIRRFGSCIIWLPGVTPGET